METINPYDWEGEVTEENIEWVRRALQERMPMRHVVISKLELFSADNLTVGDYVEFGREQVKLVLVYGRKTKEYKTIIIGGE